MKTLTVLLLSFLGMNAQALTISDILAANNNIARSSYGKVGGSDKACTFIVSAGPHGEADFAVGFNDTTYSLWFAYAYPTGSSQNEKWTLDEVNNIFSWADPKLNDTIVLTYNPKNLIVSEYKLVNQKFRCSIH